MQKAKVFENKANKQLIVCLSRKLINKLKKGTPKFLKIKEDMLEW